MTIYCPKCGAPNEGGSQFCNKCGAPLDQPNTPVTSLQTNDTVQVTKRKSGYATASLILGLIGIILDKRSSALIGVHPKSHCSN